MLTKEWKVFFQNISARQKFNSENSFFISKFNIVKKLLSAAKKNSQLPGEFN